MSSTKEAIDRAIKMANEELEKNKREYRFKGKPDHVVLRISQYGYNYHRFTINELMEFGYVSTHEKEYLKTILNSKLTHKTDNPHHIATRADVDNHIYTLLPSTVFSYIDHLELKEARSNAKQAKYFSWAAIFLSVVSIFAQILWN